MAMATRTLGFVLPTSLSSQPSFDRRGGGFRVSVIRCSTSPLTFPTSGVVEKPWTSYNARLVLEDGSIWPAKSFGAPGTRIAELVFNTSLTGYQEILTDPSYAGQFVLMTNPQIGNTGVNPDDELLQMSRSWDIVGIDLISDVSCKSPYEWVDKTNAEWDFNTNSRDGKSYKVIAYDFGIKQNILRRLSSYGCQITVVPSTFPAAEALKMNPDGILFSNGPGDPSAVPYAVETVKELLGKVPVYGICMGHQLLGQALGGKTFKMKFGHHGGNHPVRNNRTGQVEISAQNHNYAVDPASLPGGVEVTHVNLNDGSCAGLSFPEMNVMSLQYHPEASPGPHDSDNAFREFIELMKRSKQSS
ncbi:carbamoyl phosphate synthetase A [Arabidopsis thaliana]|uniref:carbamoyl-phosphate synthase (glutamine-hydrolyzing) n=1 Tax=Arabidopsis thaliana TaxID=3702 RepID=A8MRD8_ARATH|nr:carbamoyl phosphate synthetase A [Arabidopsis thaliana]AEE77359.1 carbamoyl phosphate synthetase A [Arabidopsis thaliana]|eukprot:NP_001078218.1 carbamoyl phosphate synthetase A [Arabidopsis thaliana]